VGAAGIAGQAVRAMKSFGEIIRELRKERGLTQQALASRVKKKDGAQLAWPI
jgi:ribosome-binding protein aMBF1 (putative translation factor)